MSLKKVKRFAKIVDASFKDAGRARRLSRSPQAQQEIAKDRRGALSQFTTVQDALKDRERIAAAKAAKTAPAKTAPAKTARAKDDPAKKGGR